MTNWLLVVKNESVTRKGIDPFGTGFKQKNTTEEIHKQFEGSYKKSLLVSKEPSVTVQIADEAAHEKRTKTRCA